jgi:hypothetical protein
MATDVPITVGVELDRVAGNGPKRIRVTGQQGSMWLARSLDGDFGPTLIFPPESLYKQYGAALQVPVEGDSWPGQRTADDARNGTASDWYSDLRSKATAELNRRLQAGERLLTVEEKLALAEAKADAD